jgi:hypothetical protein
MKTQFSKYARNPQAFKPGDEWHPFEASAGGTWRSGVNSDMIWHGQISDWRSYETPPAVPSGLDTEVSSARTAR